MGGGKYLKYNREQKLAEQLNLFLIEDLKVAERDYYSNMNVASFIKLKTTLSGINNILTLKVTLGFVNSLSERLKLSAETKSILISEIQNTKPNTNGYDVELSTTQKIIAEVKCNIPINGGDTYGSAQKTGIIKDIKALREGKSKSNMNPEGCLKFLVFLDLPEIKTATQKLIKNLDTRDDIIFVNKLTNLTLTDKIYIMYVNF